MTEPSGSQRKPSSSGQQSRAGDSWERRAADLTNDVQRWLIRASARNMRDELGDQVKKAFRVPNSDGGDVWATATTEPPDYLDQAPECAWCPICRAARRMAQAQAQANADQPAGPTKSNGSGGNGTGARTLPAWVGASDMLIGVARDALAGLDAILSYRPGDLTDAKPANGESPAASSGPQQPEGEQSPEEKEPDDEPDHRG